MVGKGKDRKGPKDKNPKDKKKAGKKASQKGGERASQRGAEGPPTRPAPPLRATVVPAPPPGSRSVLEVVGSAGMLLPPADGDGALRCGGCGGVLLEGGTDDVVGIVIHCPSCGSYNELEK